MWKARRNRSEAIRPPIAYLVIYSLCTCFLYCLLFLAYNKKILCYKAAQPQLLGTVHTYNKYIHIVKPLSHRGRDRVLCSTCYDLTFLLL